LTAKEMDGTASPRATLLCRDYYVVVAQQVGMGYRSPLQLVASTELNSWCQTALPFASVVKHHWTVPINQSINESNLLGRQLPVITGAVQVT